MAILSFFVPCRKRPGKNEGTAEFWLALNGLLFVS
jgi:hypothetical protein